MESDGPSPQHYSIAGTFDKYAQEFELRKSIDKSRQVLRQLWDLKKSYLEQAKSDQRHMPGPGAYSHLDQLPTIKFSFF